MILTCSWFSAVLQLYKTDVFQETVMNGNDAIFKCGIPSHVADFISVSSWVDSEGGQLGSLNKKISGKHCIAHSWGFTKFQNSVKLFCLLLV